MFESFWWSELFSRKYFWNQLLNWFNPSFFVRPKWKEVCIISRYFSKARSFSNRINKIYGQLFPLDTIFGPWLFAMKLASFFKYNSHYERKLFYICYELNFHPSSGPNRHFKVEKVRDCRLKFKRKKNI